MVIKKIKKKSKKSKNRWNDNWHEPTVIGDTETCAAEQCYFPLSNNVINCNTCDIKITGKTQDFIDPCFDTVFHELKMNDDNAKGQIVELNRVHQSRKREVS